MSFFALVDCNSFFASCERVFNPALEHRPVVVLSNNDGCAIARTAEAKKLGIKMGQPYYQFKDLARRNNVAIFSSNFSLYGDMSRRVMETLEYFTDKIEVYSIDEAFLDLSEFNNSNLEQFGRAIKDTVRQWTGMPVSIGIGPTKTLAKAANELAKMFPKYNGVLDISYKNTDEYLAQLPVGDVWGIGRQYAKLLNNIGVRTAKDLKYLPNNWVEKRMHIPGLRTVMELRGTPAVDLDSTPEPKKSIATTRSYRDPIRNFDSLAQAVASYTSRAAEKLRSQNSVCQVITVFIATNRFHDHYYSNSVHLQLPVPTAYFPELIEYANKGMEKIFKSGYSYKRAGVILSDITPAEKTQFDLFTDKPTYFRKQKLMQSVDHINLRWGTDTIKSAAAIKNRLGFDGKKFRSKNFTTDWNNIVCAK